MPNFEIAPHKPTKSRPGHRNPAADVVVAVADGTRQVADVAAVAVPGCTGSCCVAAVAVVEDLGC